MNTKKTILLFSLLVSMVIYGQHRANYFVDGYHGGIYGHYPLSWYTQFMTDQLKANSSWKIGLEIEPETWDSVRVATPQAYFDFQKVMSTSQVEYNNPTYAQPYLYNVSGESIIRQFQYGMRKLRTHFPGIAFTTYASEEPCFTSQLPQLLKLFGFKYLSLKCPDTCWGGYTRAFGGQTVNLIGPDGTAITAVPRYACEQLQPNSVWQTTAWNNQRSFLLACRKAGIENPVGMCFQDAGWKYGPWLGSHQRNTRYVRWTDYISTLTDSTRRTSHTFTQEDVLPALMWGTQVLQRIGRQVRAAENQLVQAEKLSAMSALSRSFTPDTALFDSAWRTLMLAQHHDSWIVPYNHFKHYGNWANAIRCWTSHTIALARALTDSALGVDAEGAPYVTFFNTTETPRTEVVSLSASDGTCSVQQVSVPAFGHITVPRRVVSPVSTVCTQPTITLENDLYRITFNLERGGTVSHFLDKRDGHVVYHANANDTSGYALGELRGFFPAHQRFCSSAEQPAKATLYTYDHLMQTLHIEGSIAGTRFVKTITLKRHTPLVDCHLRIFWQHNQRIGEDVTTQRNASRTAHYDTRYMLNLFFPTMLKEAKLSKDAPFDVCESAYSDTFFNSWNSIKNNVLLHWADISEGPQGHGLALFTDHTTSYTYAPQHPLALTVQYAGPGLWWRNYPLDGVTEMRYALVPHASRWDASRLQQLAMQWQEPVVARGSYVWQPSCQYIQSAFALSAVVAQPDSSLTVRLFNADGSCEPQTVKFCFPVQQVALTDLDGHLLSQLPVSNNSISLSIPRFGLANLRVSRP